MMHVQCLAVPIAGVFEWLWLGTTFSVFELACTGVVVAGVVVALAPNEKKQGIADARLAGIMFGILGAAGQAFGVVPSREAYAVLHGAGETLDGGTAAYQRIIGGVRGCNAARLSLAAFAAVLPIRSTARRAVIADTENITS